MSNRIPGFLIKSQQYYLSVLGFYNGEIDGRWNQECKEAFEIFKLDESFKPSNSRRGNGPFIPFERLPKGFKWEIFDGQRGIIKIENLPYHLAVQQLIDGILRANYSENSSSRRDAFDVLGVKSAKRENDVETGKESVSDFINK